MNLSHFDMINHYLIVNFFRNEKILFILLFLFTTSTSLLSNSLDENLRKKKPSRNHSTSFVLSGESEDERLEEASRKIDQILRTVRRGKFGVAIQTLDGKLVYERNSTNLFKPASNLKLVTSAIALVKLGPNFQIQTQLFIDGPIQNGVLQGNLILSGSADPILSGFFDKRMNEIVQSWVDTLVSMGIHQIAGEVILDNSYYVGNFGKEENDEYQPVKFFTVANFKRADANQVAKVSRYRYVKTKNGKKRLIRYGLRRGKNLQKTTIEPNIYCANLLLKELKIRQIVSETQSEVEKINYSYKIDRTNWQHIYTYYSLPLTEMLKVLNKESDNFYADQVLRTLGAEYLGEGTIEKGLEIVSRFLIDKVRLSPKSFKLADGSGLSHDNAVTPLVLVKVMNYMQEKSPYFEEYYESLSIPTVDGTLADRINHELATNIRAKTGSISGVISLSGYLKSRNGSNMMFAIICNGTNRKSVKAIEDRICKLLLEI
ncbi:MAG: D-alanyl-D-alanine carboxypeptidase/D-alanyl-D-alanine-endopeptidase [Chloroherpetonaceae bacterium]|nr:D-alanyl-D-alanine carboxypeptidase/D-alanyl-D-alanine-endopeptidase [Chloroherpetonaceae bacterium]